MNKAMKALLKQADSYLYSEQDDDDDETSSSIGDSVSKSISNEVAKKVPTIVKEVTKTVPGFVREAADEILGQMVPALMGKCSDEMLAKIDSVMEANNSKAMEVIQGRMNELADKPPPKTIQESEVRTIVNKAIASAGFTRLEVNPIVETQTAPIDTPVTHVSVERKDGVISKVTTNKGMYNVERDSSGLITNISMVATH